MVNSRRALHRNGERRARSRRLLLPRQPTAAETPLLPVITRARVPSRSIPSRPVPLRPAPSRPVPSRPRSVPFRPIPPSRPVPIRPVPSRSVPSRPVPLRPAPSRLRLVPSHPVPLRPVPSRSTRDDVWDLHCRVTGIPPATDASPYLPAVTPI